MNYLIGNQKGTRAVNANSHEWKTNLTFYLFIYLFIYLFLIFKQVAQFSIVQRRVAQNNITVVENGAGGNTLFEVPFSALLQHPIKLYL